MILAVAVRFRLRSLAGQLCAGIGKIAAVDVLHQIDDIAALAAVAAIPKLFFGVDAEPIGAAADRAWARPFDLATQMNAAARELVLDRHTARLLHPRIGAGGIRSHAPTSLSLIGSAKFCESQLASAIAL
jgi:hypothetical protein